MQQRIQYFFITVSKLIKFSLLKIRFVAERICLLVQEKQMPQCPIHAPFAFKKMSRKREALKTYCVSLTTVAAKKERKLPTCIFQMICLCVG
jgi:hypothetical protein